MDLARTMVRNATIDALRSRYASDLDLPDGEVPSREQDPAELAAEHEASEEEEKAVRWAREHRSELRLGPLQTRILELSTGMSDDQAAERLGCTPSTFRRGKARLLRKIARVRRGDRGTASAREAGA